MCLNATGTDPVERKTDDPQRSKDRQSEVLKGAGSSELSAQWGRQTLKQAHDQDGYKNRRECRVFGCGCG